MLSLKKSALLMTTILSASFSFVGGTFASTCDTGISNSAIANNGTCDISAWTPQKNSNTPGQTSNFNGSVSVTGGDTINLTGSMDAYANGITQKGTSVSLGTLLTDTSIFDETVLQYGAVQQIEVPDPISGTRVVTVYDSAGFSVSAAANPNQTVFIPGNVDDENGRGTYINSVLAAVYSDQGGGTLNVSMTGDRYIVQKQSSGFYRAYGSNDAGAAPSIINWNSNARFTFDYANAWVAGAVNNQSINYTQFSNQSLSIDGKNYVVSDIESMRQYNTALIGSMKAGGEVNIDNYNTYLNRAYTNATYSYSYNNNNTAGDSSVLGQGSLNAVYATGASAQINISKGSSLFVYSPAGTGNNVVAVDYGATLNNSGTLGGVLTTGAAAFNGSKIVNTTDGVINAGVSTTNIQHSVGLGGSAVYLANKATLTNNGIINVSARSIDSREIGQIWGSGVEANSSTVVNESDGIINVGVSTDGWWSTPVGMFLRGNGSIGTNNGVIYLGRLGQSSKADASPDIANSKGRGAQTIGVLVDGGNQVFVNNKEITFGRYIENGYAIKLLSGSHSIKNNSTGVINLNGGYNSDNANYNPLASFGIYVTNNGEKTETSYARNEGTINVGGVNNTALYAESTNGSKANVQNTGLIDITGHSTYDGEKLLNRNYAMRVVGTGAAGDLSGVINVGGNGSVGAYSRNGGIINVETGTILNLQNGKDQIGFVVWGKDSLINSQLQSLNISTENSIGFYVASGASFVDNNADGASLTFNVSGKNSVAILASNSGEKTVSSTGNDWNVVGGTKLTVNSNSTYNLTGEGAQAIRVEGGATATLSNSSKIVFLANNTIAGTVDGQNYSLFREKINEPDSTTSLTSSAHITDDGSAASGVIGFNVLNSATLNLTADSLIEMSGANNIGAYVNQGTLVNDGKISVKGVGIKVEGANSNIANKGIIQTTGGLASIQLLNDAALTLSGSGSVLADGGAHGVLLDNGASSLTMDGSVISVSGTGNGVENKADISGLQLQNGASINVEDGAGIRSNVSISSENNGTINVTGQGIGLSFQTADNGAIGTNIDLSKSNALNIDVTGANGRGIVVNHTGGGDVKTAANITVSANGGSAVSLTGVTRFTNSGKIVSASTVNPVIALGDATSVVNEATGYISSASGTALSFDNQDSTLTNSGTLKGTVFMGNGDNTVLLNAGSSSEKIIAGNGSNSFTVKGNADFAQLDGGIGGGDDSLTFDGATYDAATDGTFRHFENLNIQNSSNFTTGNTINMTDMENGVGTIHVDSASSLNFNSVAGYNFNHKLTGNGIVSSVMGSASDSFIFGKDTGEAFAGTFKAGRGIFDLADNNTRTLTNATLEVGSNNKTIVGEGNQKIGGLAFNGGTIIFEASIGDQVAKTTITANHLDANGTGNVQLPSDGSFVNDQQLSDPTKASLLEQDDQNQITRLVYADSVNYGAGAIKLLDKDGNEITDGRQADITQNGIKVAEGSYDYRLSTDDSGLYVSYGLKEVNLLGEGDNALVLAAREGASGNATDLSAKLTGTGDINVVAGANNTISLSNTLNDYTGKTQISSGTLSFRADNVLGKTSALTISAAAAVDMNGYSQAIGQLNTGLGSKINIAANSTLTINDQLRDSGDSLGGVIETNTLYGNGQFIIDPSIVAVNGLQNNFGGSVTVKGGSQLLLNNAAAFNGAQSIALVGESDKLLFDDLSSYNSSWIDRASGETSVSISGKGVVGLKNNSNITLTGNNGNFSGLFDITAGSQLTVKNQQNIGTASIVDNGIFNVDASSDWAFNNLVTGQGQLNKTGSAALIVNQALANFYGETNVKSGQLILGEANNLNAKMAGSVKIDAQAILSGQGEVIGAVSNNGIIAAQNALAQYADTAASNFTLGSLINNGTIQLAGNAIGNSLTVKGDYQSNGGSIYLNTVLGDSNSATDRLHILGNATGTTAVNIINRNGIGALTSGNGINIVQVDGTATADAFALKSDYSYKGQSAIIAGAYAYSLYASNAAGTFDGNWYLRSLSTKDAGDDGDDTGDKPVKPTKPVYSATAPLYEAYPQILQQLNKVGTLEQRVGNRTWLNTSNDMRDNAINEAEGRGFWMKVDGSTGRIKSDISKTNSSYDIDLVKTLLGLDFIATETANGKFIGGVYFQYGHAKADVDSRYGTGKISADGYGFGGTLTWYGNNGFYVDGVGQVMFYDSDIRSNWLENGYGKRVVTGNNGKGYALSIEAGKKITVNQEWAITPQVQLSYNDVDFSSFSDNYGGHVRSKDGNALTGRLGMQFDREVSWKTSDGDLRRLKAYGIGNLYYDFLNGTDIDLTGVHFRNRQDRFWGGIGTGISYNWKDDAFTVYSEIDARSSFSHFSDSYTFNGSVGFKARF